MKLQLREDRPATIEEHRQLRMEITRLKALVETAVAKIRLSEYSSDQEFADELEREINK